MQPAATTNTRKEQCITSTWSQQARALPTEKQEGPPREAEPPQELQRGRDVGSASFDTFPWPQKPKHEHIEGSRGGSGDALRPFSMRKLNYSLPPRAIFLLVFSVFSRCLPCLCLDCCDRVTDKASKRAIHAFGCRDEQMPLAVNCYPNTKRRSVLVLSAPGTDSA